MREFPVPLAVKNGSHYPVPPRIHWTVLLLALILAESIVFGFVPEPYRNFASYAVAVAWPTWLCIWIRKLDPRASSLYWALASLVVGYGFLFSWLLWIVVIFELREELLDHYNNREPMNLRLNFVLSLLFSFVYFQFALNRIAKRQFVEVNAVAADPRSSVPA
jgi:hypothetical protein